MAFVGTTRRKGSSPSKKLAMHERQGGTCPLCQQPMLAGEKLIDEHMTALGLGGTNDESNRALVHATCAYAKTFGEEGDVAKIAEAKRRKIRHLGLAAPKRRMQSAGFAPSPPKPSPGRPPEKTAHLPRRYPDGAR